MFRKIKHSGLSITLAACVISAAGCVPLLLGAAAGAGGYAWTKGVMTKQFDVSAVKLHKATLKGLKKMDLSIREDEHDRLSAKIVSQFSGGKSVKITINAVTERVSKINIRVGFIGDKTKSEMILNAIQKYL